mmetsp:Transcript_34637/g.41429  ORF Transcript_34637/g.41429 Transcript_34637/m.41429 type:complete len:99 (-) Transcript_34637:1653-1949(-)
MSTPPPISLLSHSNLYLRFCLYSNSNIKTYHVSEAYFTGCIVGIPVIMPTPRTLPSRKSILIPGRTYSGLFANSKRTFARLPGRNTITSPSSFSTLST